MKARIAKPEANWYKVVSKAWGVFCDNLNSFFYLIVNDFLGSIVRGLHNVVGSVYAAITIEFISWFFVVLPIVVCLATIREWAVIGNFALSSQAGGWGWVVGAVLGTILMIVEVIPLFGELFQECADLAGNLEKLGQARALEGVGLTFENFLGGKFNTVKAFKWGAMLFELKGGLAYQWAIGGFTVAKIAANGKTYQAFEPSLGLLWPLIYAVLLAFAAEWTLLGCTAVNRILAEAVKEYQFKKYGVRHED